ncbi:MAG: transcription elongation factor GreA [Firmicutes bacterium]|nr:transcription elongation factor GreA [Bacillota bacterium]
MSAQEIFLTQSGLKKIEKELNYLKSVKRREVASQIKTAISFGDISENSEYEDAKNEQAFIEGRIITLEKMLRNARLIEDEEIDTNIVGIGSTVTLMNLDDGKELNFTIVSSAESDPSASKISYESPVGKNIIGKTVGDIVEVQVPAGLVKYKIMNIKK